MMYQHYDLRPSLRGDPCERRIEAAHRRGVAEGLERAAARVMQLPTDDYSPRFLVKIILDLAAEHDAKGGG